MELKREKFLKLLLRMTKKCRHCLRVNGMELLKTFWWMKNNKYPIIYHPSYDIALPENHRFPGTKYSLLIKQLDNLGLMESFLKYVPKPAAVEHLSIAHEASYIQAIETGNLSRAQQVRLGLPWSTILRQRSFIAPNGTLLAAQLALQTGIACHAAGGTHHAHWDFGAGFCVFNDLAYTARALIKMKLAKRILILDCEDSLSIET